MGIEKISQGKAVLTQILRIKADQIRYFGGGHDLAGQWMTNSQDWILSAPSALSASEKSL
ncbi:MAG: hypothetical protein LWW81_06875 [Rhodocyclales bacterium]|nr:hypothetical protein [Rhodocyclales bacterium]